MKDAVGKIIEIGDTVVYAWNGQALKAFPVIGFTKNYVKLANGWPRRVKPESVAVVKRK